MASLHEDTSAVHIYELRRDRNDRAYWHLLDTVKGDEARGRPETVLSLWLAEHEDEGLMPGSYRADPIDGRKPAEAKFPGVDYPGPGLAA